MNRNGQSLYLVLSKFSVLHACHALDWTNHMIIFFGLAARPHEIPNELERTKVGIVGPFLQGRRVHITPITVILVIQASLSGATHTIETRV